MADVFLSYTRKDKKRAEWVAQLLEDTGLTVWGDDQMVAGGNIRDVVEEELEKAKAVVVLWSPVSVKSRWVLGEADKAYELAPEKLLPIKIAECELPVDYRALHAQAVYNNSGLRELAKKLSDKCGTKIEFTDKSSADF